MITFNPAASFLNCKWHFLNSHCRERLQTDWMIYDNPAYDKERLTVPQCSVRDFWCTLFMCIMLASCILPFSVTLISKGCWKSPTDTERSRSMLLSTKYAYTFFFLNRKLFEVGQSFYLLLILWSYHCCVQLASHRWAIAAGCRWLEEENLVWRAQSENIHRIA